MHKLINTSEGTLRSWVIVIKVKVKVKAAIIDTTFNIDYQIWYGMQPNIFCLSMLTFYKIWYEDLCQGMKPLP